VTDENTEPIKLEEFKEEMKRKKQGKLLTAGLQLTIRFQIS
jgi:hypothetical protein